LIVVDASAVVEFLLGTATGDRVWARISAPGTTLHAPELLDVEVAHALRRLILNRALSRERVEEAVAALGDLRATRYPHRPLLPRIWALHANLTSYDAAYVALAESLSVPLITTDTRLARSPGVEAPIEVV